MNHMAILSYSYRFFLFRIDFKYYEDASDEFRESGEGTILPLWKFTYDKAKKHHVTSISWAQSEPDMFGE